jgi:hypothetical protein
MLLTDISGNTENTANNIDKVTDKKIKLDIETRGTMDGGNISYDDAGNTIILSSTNTPSTTSVNSNIQNMERDEDLRRYRQASSIARGRIY